MPFWTKFFRILLSFLNLTVKYNLATNLRLLYCIVTRLKMLANEALFLTDFGHDFWSYEVFFNNLVQRNTKSV